MNELLIALETDTSWAGTGVSKMEINTLHSEEGVQFNTPMSHKRFYLQDCTHAHTYTDTIAYIHSYTST